MILLDTNALIGLAEGWRFRPDAETAIDVASTEGRLFVSSTAAWEIGLLATRTGETARLFAGNPRLYFFRAIEALRVAVVDLTAEMAMEAAQLPAGCPNDPADRWMIAVARITGAPLVTSDRAIISYAAQGYLAAIRWK